jgi:hypothetical protein
MEQKLQAAVINLSAASLGLIELIAKSRHLWGGVRVGARSLTVDVFYGMISAGG